MDKLKCQLCKQEAQFDLQLSKNIYCVHCGYLKYDTDEKLVLCQLECPYLYWWTTDHKYNNKTNIITVDYCMEKDECNKCGKRDFQEAPFTGLHINQEICDFCNKHARYKFKLNDDIYCVDCNKIIHDKNTKLNLCSTQCDKNPWKVVEYLSKKKNTNVKLICQISNDNCECGCVSDYVGQLSGSKIPQL